MKALLIIALLTTSLSAFSQIGQQARDERELMKISKLAKDLAAMDLSCKSSNDCKVIPLGSRACGGPAEFIVTSANNPLMRALMDVAEYSELKESEYNSTYGRVSICSVELAPIPKCVANSCL